MKKSIAPIAAAVIAPIAIALVYIVAEDGTLYSAKLKEFQEVSKDAKLLSRLTVLKHNPTNIYGTGINRRSDEARRPLYLLSKGKFIKQSEIATPAKVTKTTSAGKTVKVVQTGPQTIYIVAEAGDTRPYSVKPEAFEALQKDLTGLKYMSRLKHNPTCVEMSLTRGLISTDENRPMYRIVKGKLVQHLATEQAEKAASKPVASTTKEKAPSKREVRARKQNAAAVDQTVATAPEAAQEAPQAEVQA